MIKRVCSHCIYIYILALLREIRGALPNKFQLFVTHILLVGCVIHIERSSMIDLGVSIRLPSQEELWREIIFYSFAGPRRIVAKIMFLQESIT